MAGDVTVPKERKGKPGAHIAAAFYTSHRLYATLQCTSQQPAQSGPSSLNPPLAPCVPDDYVDGIVQCSEF